VREPALHPLDPLSADEIAAASAVLTAEHDLGPSHRFFSISLLEPSKEAMLTFAAGGEVPAREALVATYDRAAHTVNEGIVSLDDRSVRSWREIEGAVPPMMFDEIAPFEDLVRSDPAWQTAMRARGISDFSLAVIEPWAAGYFGPGAERPRRRFLRGVTYLRSGVEGDNYYARPVENLLVVVDMDDMCVIDVQDHGPVVPFDGSGNYAPELFGEPGNHPRLQGLRTDLTPLEIVQRDGPSFTISGREITWQKWRFHVGWTPREGLVLHQIAYDDGGRVRPIIYRASISELFIPYGDPRPLHAAKNVFDEGDGGLGLLSNSLTLGCDCLGEVRYFDAVASDQDGQPLEIPNAICMHEEDYGIGWKHTDFRSGNVEVRRSRRLVLSFIVTVGNYEYGVFWYFYQDGTIQFEAKLTGILSLGGVQDGTSPEHGTLVAPGVYAPNHQHFFNVRLDMSVDGPLNSVYEINCHGQPVSAANPVGNAWVAEESLLARESQAQRMVDPLAGRYWKVVNPAVTNTLGLPVGYKLVPGENVALFHDESAPAVGRAVFATHHLWVTVYHPEERFAAGEYPAQHPGGAGLPSYVAQDRSLENADVVLWYTFGSNHVARPEDWPVMPVQYAGFQLKPVGFFDANPAIDVPRADGCSSEPEHCHEAGTRSET